jgi:Enoyl-CoA hydratase/isomerase
VRLSFPATMRMEFRLAARLCLDSSGAASPVLTEMHEGVRCRLINRGETPAWRHAGVADVPRAEVDTFFEALPGVADLALGALAAKL